MPKPYEARFPVGTRVEVEDAAVLQRFAEDWRYHDPLIPAQLAYAGAMGTVSEVGFYHGGDPLYQLDDIPGVWHETCLKPAMAQT